MRDHGLHYGLEVVRVEERFSANTLSIACAHYVRIGLLKRTLLRSKMTYHQSWRYSCCCRNLAHRNALGAMIRKEAQRCVEDYRSRSSVIVW